MDWFGAVSYGTAALVFGVVTAIMLASHPGGRRATWAIAAMSASAVWASSMVLFLFRPAPVAALIALDALAVLAWTACALAWLGSASELIRRGLLIASAFLGIWSVLASLADGAPVSTDTASRQGVWLGLLGMGLVGLLAVEQLFRNADEQQREHLRLLCFGIGGFFVLNVFVYSQATLLGGVISIFWDGRGFASAALAPIVVLSLKRTSDWEKDLFLSRQVVFYTASLMAVGGYLLAMGAVAYAMLALDGDWGVLLQSLFLVTALAILACVLFSVKIRARAKVFLVKHFYRHKYDYREEWLRLTEKLGRYEDSATLARNALEGIVGIVGSHGGCLWMTTNGERYECIISLREEVGGQAYSRDHALVKFLASTSWVVDTDQYRRDAARYGNVFGDPTTCTLPESSFIVPLDRQGFLQGFVVLPRPLGVGDLNFEDHDILKTAGRQVAVVLAQALAQEQLAATKQFEAVNRLSTFLMHDLKNVVAQQELLIANAQKFRHRPEFIEDAVRTMEAGARRMRSILNRLENSAHAEHATWTDLVKLVNEVCEQCADRKPIPRFSSAIESYRTKVDRDRVAMALTHAIRNAQDATPDAGDVIVRAEADSKTFSIEVADTGTGMTREFVRDRLFKPFDSTKGAQGMGIGAYQIKETFVAAGGDVEIDSVPGRGTSLKMRLPLTTPGPAERSVGATVLHA